MPRCFYQQLYYLEQLLLFHTLIKGESMTKIQVLDKKHQVIILIMIGISMVIQHILARREREQARAMYLRKSR